MPKTTAGLPSHQHPNHPEAITTNDLVPRAIVRRHYGGGRQTVDYLVVGWPFESQPGYYKVAVRRITSREGQMPAMGRIEKVYLTDMGILPYDTGNTRKWYPDLYTTMFKRP